MTSCDFALPHMSGYARFEARLNQQWSVSKGEELFLRQTSSWPIFHLFKVNDYFIFQVVVNNLPDMEGSQFSILFFVDSKKIPTFAPLNFKRLLIIN